MTVPAKQPLEGASRDDLDAMLAEVQKKTKDIMAENRRLAAENGRLAYDLKTERASAGVQQKLLWEQVGIEKLKGERLENEVARLTDKLSLADQKIDDLYEELYEGGPGPTENVSSSTVQAISYPALEETKAKHFVLRTAPFEYKVIQSLLPSDMEDSAHGDSHRREVLKKQISVYQNVLDEGPASLGTARIQTEIMDSGLHKDAPFQKYVDPAYYGHVKSLHPAGNGPKGPKLDPLAPSYTPKPACNPLPAGDLIDFGEQDTAVPHWSEVEW